MLIVDNIGLPIPYHPHLFDSVLVVWKKAMLTIDKLVSGVAQQIDDPEVLLGLSSWHIYPDMAFLGRETTVVEQKDQLVQKGGLITVGMQNASPSQHKGISWTMPLALLQFYGKPATLQRTIGEQSIRVSFGNLVLVAIGSVISPWGRHADNFDTVCQFFDALGKSLKRSDPQGKVTFGWHELLGQQAASYLRAGGHEKQYFRRLINLGRRRFAPFMSPEPNLAPGYGLCSLDISLASLDMNEQIKTVREMANNHDLGIDLRGSFIVYRHADDDGAYFEIASIFPYQFENGKEIHRRWTCPRPIEWAQERKPGKRLKYMDKCRGYPSNFEMGNGHVFDSEGTVKRSIDLYARTVSFADFYQSTRSKIAKTNQ